VEIVVWVKGYLLVHALDALGEVSGIELSFSGRHTRRHQ
jgi:hypothetical protein